jgi:anti-sigma-K factor RskA
MIPVKHIDPDDLALYAMQLLPPDEAEELSLHLQHSVEARRVLAAIQSDLSVYALTAEMHSPPSQARQHLMQQVAREKKVVPIERIDRPTVQAAYREDDEEEEGLPMRTLFEEERKSPGLRIMPWLGWALAAGLLFEVVVLHRQQTELQSVETTEKAQLDKLSGDLDRADLVVETVKDPSAMRVNLVATGERPAPQGRVSYLADKGALVLIASNLEQPPTYKTYELWLIPSDSQHDPIPAGTFQPDAHGNATLILPNLPKGTQAKTFGVTIEDLGGAQQPTMPIVLKGAAS